jgi:arabinofuranosyltransferase
MIDRRRRFIENRQSTNSRNLLIIGILTALYLLVLVRTAWMSDDAYISLRTVDNFVQGYGLTWNAGERVQVFTHPLWLLIVAFFGFLTRELYLTTILLSIAAAASAFVLLLTRLARSLAASVLCGLILIFSPGFISFSTSGLENAFSFLLVVLFLIVLFRTDAGPRRSFFLSVLCGLIILNRFDLSLLCFPALAADLARNRGRRNLIMAAIGFAPLVLWFVFSLVYYGTIIPNPAFAKLTAGMARSSYFTQGTKYLYDAFVRETLMMVTIVVALVVGLISRRGGCRPVGAGILLYLVYLVTIGGDFMLGRLLTVPLLMSVGLLADGRVFTRPRIVERATAPAVLVVLVLGITAPQPTVLSGRDFGQDMIPGVYYRTYGIADERRYYFPERGLLNRRPLDERLGHDMKMLRGLQSRANLDVILVNTCGRYGIQASPTAHVVDRFALGDALLARLPVREEVVRIGHFPRILPAGYVSSLVTGENLIEDDRIREFYGKMKLVTRGPLLGRERWAAIVDLNLGRLDDLVRGNFDYKEYGTEECVSVVDSHIDAVGPRILLCAAEHHCNAGDFERLATILERLTPLATDMNFEYVPEMITCAYHRFNAGDAVFSERLLRLMCDLEPEDPTPRYALGSLLCELERVGEGIPFLEAAAAMGHMEATTALRRLR